MDNGLTAKSRPSLSLPVTRWLLGLSERVHARRGQGWLATSALLLFISLVTAIDLYTGDELPLMVLYLPAILASCWLQHLSVGVSLSLVCVSLWLVDDLFIIEHAGNLAHKYWLSLVHFTFFTVIAVMTWRLRLAQERERSLARTDALTGLLNRPAFVEAGQREISRSKRAGEPLAIAYLDCDNFKHINDTLGHAAGDDLLKAIANVAVTCLRQTDAVARLGGDEFACLLPAVTEDHALLVIARLKERLDQQMQAHGWPVTFSIGLVAFAIPPQDIDELIGAADELMYEVKKGRKDGVLFKTIT